MFDSYHGAGYKRSDGSLTKQIRNLGGKLGRAIAEEFKAETVQDLMCVPAVVISLVDTELNV